MLFHTNTTGPDAKGFLKGFVKALEKAKANESKQVLFKVHQLANLEGVVEETLGKEFAKSFSKNRVALYDDVHVFLETERIRSNFRSGVGFVPFGSTKLLEATISDFRSSDVVYVPWAQSEFEAYLQSHPDSEAID